MRFPDIGKVVFALGRVTPQGVNLLGTAFLIPQGYFVTAAHVTKQDDNNLVIVLPQVESFNEYQDTSNNQVNLIEAKIIAFDPFRDLCVLQTSGNASSNVRIQGTDSVSPGDPVFVFGFPHADHGRLVLTQQHAEVGAKILIQSGPFKSKSAVLNIQTRPGQSGSPIFSAQNMNLIAVLIGSYAPGGGGGVRLGNIDPATLHQTTHAVSAEYILEMLP